MSQLPIRAGAIASLLLLASVLVVARRDAAPFDASLLAAGGPQPAEGDVFRQVLTLVNGGEGNSASVEIAVPSAVMFAGVDGLPGATFDEDSRAVRWQGDIPPGGRLSATISFVAGLDAGGRRATVRATVRPWHGEPTYLEHAADIDTRPAPAVLRWGVFGMTAAGAFVIGWLVAGAAFWLVLRVVRPGAASWAPVAILLPLAFLTYFGWLAREDARISRLPTIDCTIVDRRLDARTASSTTRPGTRPSTVYKPWLALAYEVTGERRIAQGFGTDSALSRGSASAADAVMSRYAVGARVPCAIDDRDPRRAYVERGTGGAYLFALIPLPLLGLGLWGLASEGRRRR